MNIKKMTTLFIILVIIYIILQTLFLKLSHGHNVEYIVKTDDLKFQVNEKYTQKQKNETNNYYFEINVKNNIFNFQTYHNFNGRNYVIKDIKYYSNDTYTCIYPIFKTEEVVTDILCKKDNIIYNYTEIKGKDKSLDNYVDNLSEYDKTKFIDNLENNQKEENIIIYKNNLIKNHYIALENYKGLSLINKKNIYKKISTTSKDIYKKPLATFIDNYYLSADYNQTYTFNEFYLIDITNGKQKTIISNQALELDAYVMGNIDSSAYIFDVENKKQYSINIKNKNITTTGNKESGIKTYKNFEWNNSSAYDAAEKNITFEQYEVENQFTETYDKVDKVGNKLSGYYYAYKKVENTYEVYRINVQNENILNYIFTTTDKNEIYYDNEYIYYKYNNDIKYYSDSTQNKTIVTNTEFEFNDTLKYGIYIK